MSKNQKKEQAGRQGGLARKEALTPQELKAIAQRGAAARWNKPLIASHKGNFAAELGADVECYVLDDATHTAVISQTGMGKALGLSSRGNALPRFLSSKAMQNTLGAELSEKLKNPIKFQWGTPGAQKGYVANIHGFDAAVLIDLCKAIQHASAEGKLNRQQATVAKNASIIMSASAKSGIRDLVYALAGYSPTTDEVIQAFKLYVQEEAKKYESEFPPELYMAWYRLYQIPAIQGRGRPWQFKHLTVRHMYFPLAKSNGRILQLMRALKAKGGDQRKKLFQFLNELGARALRMQMGRVLEMAESSKTQAEYENKIADRFGGQHELDLVMPEPEPNTPEQTATI